MIACKQVSQTASALHPVIFEQSDGNDFFNNLLGSTESDSMRAMLKT
jgi:hypothetical protein